MRYIVDLPDYNPKEGLRLRWEEGASMSVWIEGAEVVVRGNRAGLLSLANHLLALAGPGVPSGAHVHLDEWNGLDEASTTVIIELSNAAGSSPDIESVSGPSGISDSTPPPCRVFNEDE